MVEQAAYRSDTNHFPIDESWEFMETTSQRLSEALQRISVLEDKVLSIEAQNLIQGLMYRYVEAVDQARIEDVVACFTSDGTGEFTPFADGFSGHEGIRAFLKAFRGPGAPTPRLTHVVHFPGGPLIDVAGDEATGRWDWLATCTIERAKDEPVAAWQLGRYDARFVRSDVGWRIQHLKTTYYEVFEHLRGWVGTPMVSLGGRGADD